MGGSIAMAIRLKDGRSFCQERWTNNVPYRLKDSKTYEGDTDHLLSYIDMTLGNDKNMGETGNPISVKRLGYGIIVIDALSNTIIDCNGYTNLRSIIPFQMVELDRHDPQTGAPIYQKSEYFDKLKDRIQLRQRTLGKKDAAGKRPVTVEDKGPIGHDEILRIASHDKGLGTSNGNVYNEFIIDTSPMTYFDIEERCPWQFIKDKLIEIGFPMNKKQGLNKTLYYKDGKLHRDK